MVSSIGMSIGSEPPDPPPSRRDTSAVQRLPTAVAWTHELIRARVRPGDACIDATAGNGHDTLLLAQLVGDHGRVHAFDVQAIAIDRTRQLLGQHALAHRCELLCCDHSEMSQALPRPTTGPWLAAGMFNLGYLPHGDKAAITAPGSTLPAIATVLAWLVPGGILTVVTYPGHAGGEDEAAAVALKLGSLDADVFEVQRLTAINRRRAAPEAWACVRLRA